MSDFLTMTVALLGAANAGAAGLMWHTAKINPNLKSARVMICVNSLAAIGCACVIAVRA